MWAQSYLGSSPLQLCSGCVCAFLLQTGGCLHTACFSTPVCCAHMPLLDFILLVQESSCAYVCVCVCVWTMLLLLLKIPFVELIYSKPNIKLNYMI